MSKSLSWVRGCLVGWVEGGGWVSCRGGVGVVIIIIVIGCCAVGGLFVDGILSPSTLMIGKSLLERYHGAVGGWTCRMLDEYISRQFFCQKRRRTGMKQSRTACLYVDTLLYHPITRNDSREKGKRSSDPARYFQPVCIRKNRSSRTLHRDKRSITHMRHPPATPQHPPSLSEAGIQHTTAIERPARPHGASGQRPGPDHLRRLSQHLARKRG